MSKIIDQIDGIIAKVEELEQALKEFLTIEYASYHDSNSI